MLGQVSLAVAKYEAYNARQLWRGIENERLSGTHLPLHARRVHKKVIAAEAAHRDAVNKQAALDVGPKTAKTKAAAKQAKKKLVQLELEIAKDQGDVTDLD